MIRTLEAVTCRGHDRRLRDDSRHRDSNPHLQVHQPLPRVPLTRRSRPSAAVSHTRRIVRGATIQPRCGPSDAPPLTGVNFVTFWGTRSVGDLFNYIMDIMPPATPGALGDETTVNVVAYILQRMGTPAGASDLTSNATTALNAIGRAGGRGAVEAVEATQAERAVAEARPWCSEREAAQAAADVAAHLAIIEE